MKAQYLRFDFVECHGGVCVNRRPGQLGTTLARWEDYSTSMIWISGLVQFRPFLGNTDGRVADSPVSAPVAASLQEIPLARLPTESLVVWPQPLVV